MLKHKNAVGTFSDLHQIELVIEQLKSAGFPVSNVSVIVPQPDAEDPQLEKLTEPVVQSESEFTGDRPAQVAAKAGAVGTVVGGVVAGLTTLAFPAFSGAVVLVGMATGAFYGAVSGGVLGGESGLEISATQAQLYDDRLAQGQYLLIVKGSDDEIDRAESVLKTANIQDWMVFNTL
jgi:outer membrane lipoprotein SlyB